ncbi:hypothetical protein COV53_04845 [Candidatus Gottesmanbacteria bacterium CG11_big_fil_rev_8_21_14_0_20_37_11]|uniref:Uncharacterized protein n=2 Tax=Candidatus Gottesmaniibacteriota TaxID=1752720 RepID=A0A2M7RQK0_9BACT|nr:MAG: hypothetical protein COX23_03995 [Candidatus Gottesmanbacteria bacterium CG23_combo_of_CG06-09_8_20_14_all_37_19]PIR08088.1 MAG: hypothetical protein COV53_04845 [Candidatus Gottesmanbacteria bacterium CG11_big_fil_rev_8_21_14_0_20_37_11]PIZ02542.1 MAG: hypothetical protein COY59_04240 [Candidatus Gottesmanbacteria bacterium CG_4_10_14_0_8_um_filter_37_24]PJA53029.1 MAG: hypothetical protein CO166_03305 [Candidatus Roizmanbacteria bacterium CG_4_9_14_3_um_filter_36_11]
MKNFVIIACVAVFIVIGFLANTRDSDNSYSKDKDRISELENCLEEYKSVQEEYETAIRQAKHSLEYFGDGSDYQDLINSRDEAVSSLYIGSDTPICY